MGTRSAYCNQVYICALYICHLIYLTAKVLTGFFVAFHFLFCPLWLTSNQVPRSSSGTQVVAIGISKNVGALFRILQVLAIRVRFNRNLTKQVRSTATSVFRPLLASRMLCPVAKQAAQQESLKSMWTAISFINESCDAQDTHRVWRDVVSRDVQLLFARLTRSSWAGRPEEGVQHHATPPPPLGGPLSPIQPDLLARFSWLPD